MIRSLPLFFVATPALAHPLSGAHLHSDGAMAMAAGVALIITALALAFIGARK